MGENINTIKNLLQNVAIIQKKYDEIAQITGENFNVFSVMNMELNEVKTHSAIIGEFLNPNGSHRQGSVFLDLFVEQIKESFNSEEYKIELENFGTLINDKICERTIGISNDWDDVSGGRIDIIIEDTNQILIIENKPGFQDQPFQLIRYNNYAKTKNQKKVILFYLTLDGRPLKKEETPYVINEINVEGHNFKHNEINEYVKFKEDCIDKDNIHHCLYYPISFEIHIRDWIEKCLEKTHSLPIIRETLVQYLHLIKKITNQSTNNKMSIEIVEKMEKEIGASFEIVNNISELKNKLYYDFFRILREYTNINEMDCDEKDIKNDTEYGLYIIPKGWNSKLYQIGVFFERDYSGLYVGLWYGKNEEEEKTKIREKFTKKDNTFQTNNNWIWKNPTNCNWKDNSEIWKDVALGKNGQTYKEIVELIEQIIRIEKS
jgi:hypothetical protein